MTNSRALHLVLGALILGTFGCSHPSSSVDQQRKDGVRNTVPDHASRPAVTPNWPLDPTTLSVDDEPELRRAWERFVSTSGYQLARPEDRTFTEAAISRMGGEYHGRVVPAVVWWGLTGFEAHSGQDSLVAIVVNPRRSDPNRYALVVLASPASSRGRIETYWVVRDANLGAWALAPTSGSVLVHAYAPEGRVDAKDITWNRARQEFELR
jgi:hypothetical protein